jgi:outer membrane protein TolC
MRVHLNAVSAAVVAVALALAAAHPAHAQSTPLRLTLDEAVAKAVDASHRLGEARARQAGAEAAVVVRSKADQPSASASAGYTRTNHVDEFGVPQPSGALRVIYPDIPDNFRTRLELVWPVYTGGRADALERAAQAEATATGSDLAAVRLDLHLEVARAYWALVTAAETVRVLDAAVVSADQSLADVRTRVEAGFLPPNDVSRSEAQRARQALLLIEAKGRVQAVTVDLSRLMGLTQPVPIEPVDRLESPALASSDTGALVTEALGQRPELTALSLRADSVDARLSAIAATRKPTVAFASGYDVANPNPRIFPRQDVWQDSFDISLNVSWNVWDSGRAAAERTEVQAAATALRERKADTESQIRADVQKQLVELASSRAALVPAGLAVTAAEETRRVVNDRYDAGVATTLDVLDAQLAVLQAALDRTRVLADIRLSEARLARILGR